jgi:hypothetical protein
VPFTSDLHLKLGNSSLEAEELLLEGCLFSLERGNLLLDSAVLSFLEVKMTLPE